MHYTTFIMPLLLCAAGVYAQPSARLFSPEKIQIEWQLVTNGYEGKEQFLADFTLTNSDDRDWPAAGWCIYFNANRGIVKKDMGYGLEISQIHGDLFSIRPTAAFKGLKARQRIAVRYVGELYVFNVSDAPTGYYWVWEDQPRQPHAIPQSSAKPPQNLNQFKRADQQENDQITPEMVFNQNQDIEDIPVAQLPKIFPTPVFCAEKPGFCTLNAQAALVNDPAFAAEAQYLKDVLREFLQPGDARLPSAGIRLVKDSTLPEEAYTLTISPQQIDIAGATPRGIFYGIQSLKSAVAAEAWKSPVAALSLPCMEVRDHPRFAYRGLHVDVARNFQQKEEILRLLNWMALYKLNTLHFHFSDDEGWRIEIPELPELTTVGSKRGHTLDSREHLPATYGSGGNVNNPQSAFYTRRDYIEILKFAKARHITVIPEIETPGHARAAIKAMNARYARFMQEGKPEEAKACLLADPDDRSSYISAQYFTDNVMCVAMPSVYRFIEITTDALISMHEEAGMPLKTIHVGGDEVPGGVWEKSPLCQALLKQLPADQYRQTSDLWLYYWEKVADILKKRRLYVSGWEEIGMRETKLDGNKMMMVNPLFANRHFHTYVWNTVIGWGMEDLPYRLANGGYKVVLCPVSNLYFDLAYQKDFEETGYYWGGFVDMDKPFYFIPFDYLKNTKVDRFGHPVDPKIFVGRDRLTDYGKSNIIGIQGHLWSENLRSVEQLEYAAFPKVLALAERAWAADPEWATTRDADKSAALYRTAWSQFVNVVGKKELPKLNYYQGGVRFRIPTVGAKIIRQTVCANVQIPGMTIRYTTDGSEPSAASPQYVAPVSAKGRIRLRAFDVTGRGGRTVEVRNE